MPSGVFVILLFDCYYYLVCDAGFLLEFGIWLDAAFGCGCYLYWFGVVVCICAFGFRLLMVG